MCPTITHDYLIMRSGMEQLLATQLCTWRRFSDDPRGAECPQTVYMCVRRHAMGTSRAHWIRVPHVHHAAAAVTQWRCYMCRGSKEGRSCAASQCHEGRSVAVSAISACRGGVGRRWS